MCAHIVGSVRKVMPAQGVRITTAAGRVCRVPAGDFCCISFIVPHRDAAVFPEPLTFKPDRHFPTNTTNTTAADADSSNSVNRSGTGSSSSANTTVAAAAAAGVAVDSEGNSSSSTDQQPAEAAEAAAAAAVASATQQQQGCVPHAGLWHYSAGAHRCPGEHFAGLLMRTVVWTLASRYDMQVCTTAAFSIIHTFMQRPQ
jgi:cytochrome P450